MNKKGFTLIELMTVIVLLVFITILVLPNVVNRVNNKSSNVDDVTKSIIIEAAKMYVLKNSDYYHSVDNKSYCIGLNELVKKEYLKDSIKDIKSKKDITNLNSVKVTYSNGKLEYEIVSNSSCSYVCKRATKLHTELCLQNDDSKYCSANSYAYNDKITYGSLGTKGKLTSGDAFDCDVNSDGEYDPELERFYYVSGIDGNDNSDYSALIYSNNFLNGIVSRNAVVTYNLSNNNFVGPIDVYTNLPTEIQWNNVRLSRMHRQIVSEINTSFIKSGEATYNLPNFSYKNYSSRLLTYNEFIASCNTSNNTFNLSCKYLLENTSFSTPFISDGLWLETPNSIDKTSIWYIDITDLSIKSVSANEIVGSIRPVIEVLNTELDY